MDKRFAQLAGVLRSNNGTMCEMRGSRIVSDAAFKGDVRSLNLLVKYAGLEVCRPLCWPMPGLAASHEHLQV